jgi:hypothetical protein
MLKLADVLSVLASAVSIAAFARTFVITRQHRKHVDAHKTCTVEPRGDSDTGRER